jgi:hypothetical protein
LISAGKSYKKDAKIKNPDPAGQPMIHPARGGLGRQITHGIMEYPLSSRLGLSETKADIPSLHGLNNGKANFL